MCDMYWSEILDHAQGVMILEGIENARVALPMTDQAGMMQFRRGQKEQMKGIWDTMFPLSDKYRKKMDKKRNTFKSNKEVYKRIEDNINRERGLI